MSLPKYVNIKDSTTLVRDTFSMGIINTNTNALHEYKCRCEVALQKLADERRRDKELYTLRKEVAELKELVQQILGAVKVV